MDVTQYNREAWDQQVKSNCRWTRPVNAERIAGAREGKLDLVLTPQKPVPADWYPELKGCNVLCLASGGGQQAPMLAAAGAIVTVFDNSPEQLNQDRHVAERESLQLTTVQGDMRDLSQFDDESFGLVFQPSSFSFVSDVRPVFQEVARVLKPGGVYMVGFLNPFYYVFDYDQLKEGNLVVRHSIPYSDLTSISDAERQQLMEENEPFCFGHSLEHLIGGQLAAGLRLTGFFEDYWGHGAEKLLDRYLMTNVATCAVKPT